MLLNKNQSDPSSKSQLSQNSQGSTCFRNHGHPEPLYSLPLGMRGDYSFLFDFIVISLITVSKPWGLRRLCSGSFEILLLCLSSSFPIVLSLSSASIESVPHLLLESSIPLVTTDGHSATLAIARLPILGGGDTQQGKLIDVGSFSSPKEVTLFVGGEN